MQKRHSTVVLPLRSSIVCEVNETVFFYKYYKCLKRKIKIPQLTFIKTNQPKIHK